MMGKREEKKEEKKEKQSMQENGEKWGRWKEYVRVEIGIEYKACLYFFAMLFYYCCYLVLHQIYAASILHMAEMIFAAYVMGYMQVYLMGNFDEADLYGCRGFVRSVFCTGIYAALSYVSGWFDKNIMVTVLFALYVLLAYFCMFLINKIKRDLDTRMLNNMLTEFKKSEED